MADETKEYETRSFRVKPVEESPITITISGPRGSGKTQIANLLEAALTSGSFADHEIKWLRDTLGTRLVVINEEIS